MVIPNYCNVGFIRQIKGHQGMWQPVRAERPIALPGMCGLFWATPGRPGGAPGGEMPVLSLCLWVPSSAQHCRRLPAYLVFDSAKVTHPYQCLRWRRIRALPTFRSATRMQSFQSTARLPSLPAAAPLSALLESTSNSQVHPVVSRLCAPIDGTDPARLAHCLGLDASRFHKQVQGSAAQAREEIQLTGTACCDDEDRYKVSLRRSTAAASPCSNCSAALQARSVGARSIWGDWKQQMTCASWWCWKTMFSPKLI